MGDALRLELDTRSTEAIDGRQLRAAAFQEVRLEYVRRVLHRHGGTAAGSRALVVGSGRGDLARGLAQLGFRVVALDPSPLATEMARERSAHAGLSVLHETAPPEELGHQGDPFDLAYYADTLEITSRLDRVVGEAARVLRPGGHLCYDTVNRTWLARLVYLGAFERLAPTRIMPRGRYEADRLRPPTEVAAALARHGLQNEDVCGFKPADPRDLLRAVHARKRGAVTDDEVAPLTGFRLDPDGAPLVTYLGHARRL